MPRFRSLSTFPTRRSAKYSVAGVATAGVAALTLSLVPGSAESGERGQSVATEVSTAPVAFTGQNQHAEKQLRGIAQQLHTAEDRAEAQAEKAAKAEEARAVAKAVKEQRALKEAASRKAERSGIGEPAAKPATKPDKPAKKAAPSYPDNLDGWIREAMAIMDRHGIPGSYEGIHRNIMRESSGDPNAVNDWDINAQNGTPSKGLLQVIWPTFEAYHVEGTSWNLTDPVANIVAACNYAADRYGSMDNVDSAY
jgi:hypothetical protein